MGLLARKSPLLARGWLDCWVFNFVWYNCSSGVSMPMCYVVLGWMVFGVVISKVVAALVPEDSELTLGVTAFEPVEAHF